MPRVRDLVVEQLKHWSYPMKQTVASFHHPFPLICVSTKIEISSTGPWILLSLRQDETH